MLPVGGTQAQGLGASFFFLFSFFFALLYFLVSLYATQTASSDAVCVFDILNM